MISIVAAMGKNREIGQGNELLWAIPDDLKRFKALTSGHPVIMGRKTFGSLPPRAKPLPGRTNIVITRDPSWSYEGTAVTHSIEEAIKKAKEIDKEEIFVIGGAQIYEQALLFVDKLYLTLIDANPLAGGADAYFPAYEHLFTKKLSEEPREFNGIHYTWIDLEK